MAKLNKLNGPQINNTRGSIWNRWEPHIHAPGTLLNNQYKGPDELDDFLKRIEESDPLICALGITDYYSIDIYQQILEEKNKRRLANVQLLFANIELRFSVETSGGKPINGHLLVSPEDANHIAEIKRFLNRLSFTYDDEKYHCNKEDLIKLGYKHDKTIKDDRKAHEAGANQFKINYTELFKEIKESDWAKTNILFCVSGNTTDGTSGLKKDASFNLVRTEIERHAQIIFSSQPKQRDFWLGKGAATIIDLNEKWGGRKPCLHGSDAHENKNVGKPDLDRFSWIKGDLTFESLRQACLEPEERAFVGSTSPDAGITSKVIKDVIFENAPWIKIPSVELNPGLIAIIGARGSGKTALADLIAAGGLALSTQLNPGSFLKRAEALIEDEKVSLNWTNGETTGDELKNVEIEDIWDYPKVQYLSQQFVEELCSSEGLTDKLMTEIERVVFQAHKIDDRMGTTTFRDLLEIRSVNSRNDRSRNEELLAEISQEMILEYESRDSLPQLNKTIAEKKIVLENDKKIRQGLVAKGKEDRQSEFSLVSSAIDVVRAKVDSANKRHLALKNLQTSVQYLQKVTLPSQLQKMKQEHKNTGLTDEQWKGFNLVFSGNVNQLLTSEIAAALKTIEILKGNTVEEWEDKNQSYLSKGRQLHEHNFSILSAEFKRLQALTGIDNENARKYNILSDRIGKTENEIVKLQEDINYGNGAAERIKNLIEQRKDAYQGVFQAIIDEETELTSLYEPLMKNLREQTGTLSKLKFYVHRTVDIDAWADQGEQLLDLRKVGDFKGKGALAQAAIDTLKKSWQTGSAYEVSQSMDEFRKKYDKVFQQHKPVLNTDRDAYRQWIKQLGEWLYSTDHIKVVYGIEYDHLDIKQLSPGTRGIVLLMLYLAIDKEDDRPLIIDQPEENLDPKSIFDELVPIFRAAKQRRQIIIITHNANLVVNTDADQVIVATCKEHKPNKLPPISYSSGGIENPEIRKSICEILEGGEAAFRERAKRLRINFQ